MTGEMDSNPNMMLLALRQATPSWSGIAVQIEKTDLLNADQKKKGLDAVIVFQRVLIKGFFKENGQEHPLQRCWGNIVPWQVEQLSGWAVTLEQIEGTSSEASFRYLRDLLRSRIKCQQEGVHFLRLATRLLKAGFAISFIEGNQAGKSPDIAVTDPVTKTSFYIEVTHLEKSTQYKGDENVFSKISNAAMTFAPFLLTHIHFTKRLSDVELSQAIGLIKQVANRVYSTGKLQFDQTAFISIAFAPEKGVTEFNEWLNKNDKRKGIWGLDINPDETQRLTQQRRIEKKSKQIPDGATGFIYFGVEFLFFLTMDRSSVLNALKKSMGNCTQVKGIVLFCHALDPCDSYSEKIGSEDLYSVKSCEGYTDMQLYCNNDHYSGNLPVDVFNCFKKALTR